MDSTTVSMVTEVLVDFLLGCFSVLSLCWGAAGIQTIINDHRREKREQESAKRDVEYHEMRMKELNK